MALYKTKRRPAKKAVRKTSRKSAKKLSFGKVFRSPLKKSAPKKHLSAKTRKKISESLLRRYGKRRGTINKKVLLIGFAVMFGGIGTYIIVRPKAAVPKVNRIAFAEYAEGEGWRVIISNPDGTNRKIIQKYNYSLRSPRLSPDGAKVAYLCSAPSDGICVSSITGSGLKQVVAADTSKYFWHPTKPNTVTYLHKTEKRLYEVNVTTGIKTKIGTTDIEASFGLDISQDGQKLLIVTSTGNGLFVANYDGSNQQALGRDGQSLGSFSCFNGPADWSADGKYIVCRGKMGTGTASEWGIIRVNSDGTNPIMLAAGTVHSSPVFSPDSQSIIFKERPDATDTKAVKLTVITIDGSIKKSQYTPTFGELIFDLTWELSTPISADHNHADFNGDGYSDIFWYAPGSAADSIWYGKSLQDKFDGFGKNVNGTYKPVTGDFNADGASDVYWYAPGGAADAVWYGTGTKGSLTSGASAAVQDCANCLPLAGDFNGDGYSDIFWYAPGSAADYIWSGSHQGQSIGTYGQVQKNVNGTYRPVTGDFNGDGYSDIFWYAPGTAADSVWYGKSTRGEFTTVSSSAINATYLPLPGDFNGDGYSDIIWYAPGTAADSVWYGNPTQGQFTKISKSINGTYKPITGDFNGDGISDVFWYGTGTASDASWYGTSTKGTFTNGSVAAVNGTYAPFPSLTY